MRFFPLTRTEISSAWSEAGLVTKVMTVALLTGVVALGIWLPSIVVALSPETCGGCPVNPAYFLLAPFVAAGVAALAAGQLPALFESQAATDQEPSVPESEVVEDDDWRLMA